MRINFYADDENIIHTIKNIPVDDVKCKFFMLSEGEKINLHAMNIIIIHALPRKYISGAKYILCSHNPDTLTQEQLTRLYDIWPSPMTHDLLSFMFRKVIECIKSLIHTTKEEQEHHKRILEMARQDYLTGLATRWYLQEYVEHLRYDENITCIYFDLDNFKQLNDTYGHQAGDRALAATAEMMQNEFASGFCARMGGDEFMIVMKDDVIDVAEKVNAFMQKLTEYYATTGTMQGLSVSAGISGGIGKGIDRLIHESDIALYEAKNSGRACSRIYAPELEAK